MGVLPIAEIPYAKYVDCGYDQLTEAAIMHWVSIGKFKNGMILRLQGIFFLFLFFFSLIN